MSKRALKAYLYGLTKEQLEDQVLDLYQRFKEVKIYYDFTFNPSEDKLIAEAKFKISKEYFPQGKRRPKARRSIAQKYIKHFLQIGMEAGLLADLMLYTVEVGQAYNAEKPQKAEAFFKSMANSFEQAIDFIRIHGLKRDFWARVEAITHKAEEQEWFNLETFYRKVDEGGG